MTDIKSTVNRRDFLRGATYAGLALSMGLPLELSWSEEQHKKTKVVLIRDADIFDKNGRINPEVIEQMLNRSVKTLFDKDTASDAWQQIIKPDDIVGIKSNVWNYLPTPVEIERVIKNRVLEAGVPDEKIDISDRGVLGSKIFLNATALINVRPLRTHHWSGIGGCIKNYITFVPEPYKYHDNSCADLAKIWYKTLVKDKTRLNVLVLLTPLFYGIGPHHFDKTYVWNYNGILVGTDPVAVDAIGVAIIDAKRRAYFEGDKPILPPPHHVAYADIRHKLGTSDLEKIELVKLGWQKDILI